MVAQFGFRQSQSGSFRASMLSRHNMGHDAEKGVSQVFRTFNIVFFTEKYDVI